MTKKFNDRIEAAPNAIKGNRPNSKYCQMSLSMALIEYQISDLSDKIDLVNTVATEISEHFLSETGHLTSGVMSPSEVKEEIKSANTILKQFGKKIAISLATAYMEG